jgi:signal peptidase I
MIKKSLYIKSIGILILIIIFLRIFVLASFKITTSSMNPTLTEGDYILVNRLISCVNIHKNIKCGLDNEKLRFIVRNREVQRNDILVFALPEYNKKSSDIDKNTFYVKRCIAIPGDTFYIKDGFYKVKNYCDTLGYYQYQLAIYDKPDSTFQREIYNLFPFKEMYNWNIKNFGPLYVPKKNDIVTINRQSIDIYKKLISYETNKQIAIRNDTIFLEKDLLENYRFQQNYYFMAGDFALDSKDSRYWGLLPENQIIGKAILIWKSQDIQSGKYNWDRFFLQIK